MSKTEYKAAAKATFAAILGAIDAGLAGIARVEEEAAKQAATFEVQIGMALDRVRSEMAAAKAAEVSLSKVQGIGTDDWRVYARENLPGKSNGTIYRWQNAGHVAQVLGDLLVPGTLVGALVPLYRFLSNATGEDRQIAEDLVRETYKEAAEAAGTDEEGNPIAPVEADILARSEVVFPTNRTGGSKKAAAEKATDDDDDDSDDDDSDDTRRESSESLTVVDAASVEAATGPADAIMRGILKDHPEVTREVLVGIMLATLRLASEHGTGTIVAVLGSTKASS